MPYAIQTTDASVEAALRRIAGEEAGAALATLGADGPLGPRVHAMRKSVKKLRGLLRLVRPVMGDARAEDAVLRDAGRGLSGLRDAAVLRATAESLAEAMGERGPALVAPFRAAAEAQDEAADARHLPPFAAAMAALAGRAESWRVRGDGWEALSPGLGATWDRGRTALREARAHPGDAERLHEWRKRAKDHWYQARLLAPIWPALMDPQVAEADRLGEALGLMNDLAVLRARLPAMGLDAALAREADVLAEARLAVLRGEAIPLGRRLYADRPEALARRWGKWWALAGMPRG